MNAACLLVYCQLIVPTKFPTNEQRFYHRPGFPSILFSRKKCLKTGPRGALEQDPMGRIFLDTNSLLFSCVVFPAGFCMSSYTKSAVTECPGHFQPPGFSAECTKTPVFHAPTRNAHSAGQYHFMLPFLVSRPRPDPGPTDSPQHLRGTETTCGQIDGGVGKNRKCGTLPPPAKRTRPRFGRNPTTMNDPGRKTRTTRTPAVIFLCCATVATTLSACRNPPRYSRSLFSDASARSICSFLRLYCDFA